jgi:hypothetical protein
MASSPQPQPAPARSTASTAKPAVPDYIAIARKADEATVDRAQKNPIYNITFAGTDSKEQRIAKLVKYLTEGLADGTANAESETKRRQELAEINAAIQVLRRQLGSDQAKEITSKIYADLQRIVNETSDDVGLIEDELSPLYQLAELFSTYGADGNIIEKINAATCDMGQRA